MEHTARRARNRRHGHRSGPCWSAARRRDSVLRLRVQHHRSAQARRRHVLVVRGRLELPDGADDARRQRHPRKHLPLALVRLAGHARSWVEDRHAEQPARRVRADALGDRRPEPRDVPRTQGAHARQGGPHRRIPASPTTTARSPSDRRAARRSVTVAA